MPIYQFEAMDATGMEIRDKIDAPDEEEAMAMIRQMGYFVTKIGMDSPPVVARSKDGWTFIIPTQSPLYALLFLAGFLTGFLVAAVLGAR